MFTSRPVLLKNLLCGEITFIEEEEFLCGATRNFLLLVDRLLVCLLT
jgi:hypothetical protein